MPELPEVETVRRDLDQVLEGRSFSGIQVSGRRTVRRQAVDAFVADLKGQSVIGTRRLGKFLIVDLANERSLLVHLRMSGQLFWMEDRNQPLLKHTHARLLLAGGGELRFVDPRTFGELWTTSPDLPDLAHIGPDALNDLPSPKALAERLKNRRSVLKTVLLNQAVVAGIGNIYADEILWAAELRNDRIPASLTKPAWERLHGAIQSVLTEGVANRGTSMVDEQYKDIFGNLGQAQKHHNVLNREGQPCFRCSQPILRIKLQGRSTYWCRRCQK